MYILIVLNLILFVVYNVIIFIRNKSVPESISETAYIWEKDCSHKNSHRAFIFSVYCVITAILLFIPWFSITLCNFQFICYIGCMGFLIAGATPFFKEKSTAFHYIGGILSLICWLVWMVIFKYYLVLFIDLIVIAVLVIFKKKDYVYWTEIVSLFSFLILLLIIV